MITDTWQESYQERAAFAKVRMAENSYSIRLRKLAQHIYEIVKEFANPEGIYEGDFTLLENMLTRYSNIIEPWARSVASRFLAEVSRRDDKAWATYARKMSRALRQEIETAPTGEMLQRFLETQVQLITSLPLEAAQRVHEIAIGNLYRGARFPELAKHILDTGHVTKGRAYLIARTETARVASTLTMVRAQHIGADQYIWRTVKDGRVRDSHHKMEGKVISWNDPPVVDVGVPPYHAGMVWNCRCFCEPIIPDRYRGT